MLWLKCHVEIWHVAPQLPVIQGRIRIKIDRVAGQVLLILLIENGFSFQFKVTVLTENILLIIEHYVNKR